MQGIPGMPFNIPMIYFNESSAAVKLLNCWCVPPSSLARKSLQVTANGDVRGEKLLLAAAPFAEKLQADAPALAVCSAPSR